MRLLGAAGSAALPYFESLHINLSIPVILVSHDIAEVERLADHLVVLKQGRVMSTGPLNQALTYKD